MKLKLTYIGHPASIIDIADTLSYQSLLDQISQKYSIPSINSIILYTGFPPTKIQGSNNDTLNALGIKGGSIIDIRLLDLPSSSLSTNSNSAITVSSTSTTSNNTNNTSQSTKVTPVSPVPANGWTCNACTYVNSSINNSTCEICGTSRNTNTSFSSAVQPSSTISTVTNHHIPITPAGMVRHVVPADNTCLFTAIGWLIDRRMDRGGYYRNMIVNYLQNIEKTIQTNSQQSIDDPLFTEAGLGRPLPDYITYISKTSTWGGATELIIFSRILQLEIVAIEIQTCHVYRFGENKNYTKRIYMIYDGIHYDALHYREDMGGGIEIVETILPAGDTLLDAALIVANDLRKKRQFVDPNRFSIMCGTCSVGLIGQKEAVEHAKQTGHTNFQEYKK